MIDLREWLSRLAGLLRRRRGGRQIDEELEFHIDMAAERFRRQGMEPADARRAARVELGGLSQTMEAYADQQSIPHAERLLQDARYGFRALVRTPAFTITALLTAGLGIGANVAIFSVVYAVLLRPLPFADSDRLVTVGDLSPSGAIANVGFATFADIRDRTRTFESLTAIRSWAATLVAENGAELVPGMRVSWDFFQMLGKSPALGRNFAPADDRQAGWTVVLLSDALWRRRFGGDPTVVGRRIRMGGVEFEVIGVMPPDVEPIISSHFYQPAEIWAPLGYEHTLPYACRSCQHLRAMGRLKRGVSRSQALDDLNGIRRQLSAEHPTDYPAGRIGMAKLSEIVAAPVRSWLLILLGAVVFVLLIACVNVAHLLLARGTTRSREMAVRAALGASRGRLIRQLLTESAMLGLAGGALGLATAAVLLRGLEQLAPVEIPRLSSVGIDGPVLAFAVVLSLATGLGFGLLPALRASSADLRQPLSADPRTSSSRRIRDALVIADVALALILLTGAGLMLRSVGRLMETNPGFDPRGVLTLQFSLVGEAYREDPAVVAFQDRVLEQVRAIPGVDAVALAGQIPMGGNFDRWGFHVEGKSAANPADNPEVERYSVSPDYFRVMRIPLLRGRLITEGDTTSAQQVIVVSDATARMAWGGEDPIGKRVRIGPPDSPPRTVVGVVDDVRHAQLTETRIPQMYLPQKQVTDSYLVMAIRSNGNTPDRLASQVRNVLRALDPGVPVYEVALLDTLVARSFADRRFVMRLLGAFAASALFLAAIGLYGVIAFVVAQRTREVGVRIALGARPQDILTLVLGTGSRSVAIGLFLGIIGALALSTSLDSLLVGVTATDPVAIGGAVGLLGIVAIAAHMLPAVRALRVDPVTALRNE